MVLLFSIAFVACGGDSSTSVNDGDGGSEAAMTSSSRHSGPGPESSSSKKVSSSSSSTKIVSSSWTPDGGIGSSNSTKKPSSSSKTVVQSSSSRHSGLDPESSSGKKDGGSSSAMTSSSSVTLSGASAKSNGSSAASSSSEYVPFDHSKTHANASKVGKDAYKQFTDPRNGRSYYYIKIVGKKSSGRKDSVTIMAENLNIGEMVLGKNDQNDDTKIERYCYNNDTTKCDEFGGLYQWAEMMQLPSRCNTESCSELIQENHRGICPEGWRLMTYDDFVVIEGYKDEFGYGIKGLRSAYGFGGNNYSGFSLTGAGLRTAEGGFSGLYEKTAWFRPEEYEEDKEIRAHHGLVSAKNESTPQQNHRELKTKGFSVRCVKLE